MVSSSSSSLDEDDLGRGLRYLRNISTANIDPNIRVVIPSTPIAMMYLQRSLAHQLLYELGYLIVLSLINPHSSDQLEGAYGDIA